MEGGWVFFFPFACKAKYALQISISESQNGTFALLQSE